MKMGMSVARGLTRLKTIKGQLAHIQGDLRNYSSFNSKLKNPIADTTPATKLIDNQKAAQAAVDSLLQQESALIAEFVKIKTAIDTANLATKITLGGKTLSIAEALVYKRDAVSLTRNTLSSIEGGIVSAQRNVDQYNTQFSKVPEELKPDMLGEVIQLVPKTKIDEMRSFILAFDVEFNTMLNEINATTVLEGIE